MKAVMPRVPEDILERRRRSGADQWDEVWDGVLHMPPAPNRHHQDLEGALEVWLRIFWARPNGYRVYHQINLAAPGGWPDKNYRIPDLVLLTPDRFHIDHNEYFEGAPNVVVEIHSPDDEAYEKLPFYASLGIPEVWIIHRDSKVPEIHALGDDGYEVAAASADGWIRSAETGVELRPDENGRLSLRLAGDESTRQQVPED